LPVLDESAARGAGAHQCGQTGVIANAKFGEMLLILALRTVTQV
jgi:hypothetical protein